MSVNQLELSKGERFLRWVPSKYRRKMVNFLWGALLPVLILATWQILGNRGVISTMLFPTPFTILESFVWMWESGVLVENLNISIMRALGGFAVGAGAGLVLGLFVGLFHGFEKLLDTTVQMIRMIPHVSVTFLFVLWFGIGETSKTLLIAKGSFFPLYIYSFLGIRNVDNKLFEVTRVLGYSRFKQIVRLIFPATIPNIFLGIRLSLAIAWVSLVVAEMMSATHGIGYLMMDARAFSDTPTVFVGIALFTILGKTTDSIVLAIERRLLRWNEQN